MRAERARRGCLPRALRHLLHAAGMALAMHTWSTGAHIKAHFKVCVSSRLIVSMCRIFVVLHSVLALEGLLCCALVGIVDTVVLQHAAGVLLFIQHCGLGQHWEFCSTALYRIGVVHVC